VVNLVFVKRCSISNTVTRSVTSAPLKPTNDDNDKHDVLNIFHISFNCSMYIASMHSGIPKCMSDFTHTRVCVCVCVCECVCVSLFAGYIILACHGYCQEHAH